jgi:hypothetical protein
MIIIGIQMRRLLLMRKVTKRFLTGMILRLGNGSGLFLNGGGEVDAFERKLQGNLVLLSIQRGHNVILVIACSDLMI